MNDSCCVAKTKKKYILIYEMKWSSRFFSCANIFPLNGKHLSSMSHEMFNFIPKMFYLDRASWNIIKEFDKNWLISPSQNSLFSVCVHLSNIHNWKCKHSSCSSFFFYDWEGFCQQFANLAVGSNLEPKFMYQKNTSRNKLTSPVFHIIILSPKQNFFIISLHKKKKKMFQGNKSS